MRTTAIPKKQLEKLEQELLVLRSFIIGLAGQDNEGNYRPDFVDRILQANREEVAGEFVDSQSFLSQIQ